MPGAVVIGAGPGIGLAVAHRFANEGMHLGLIARSPHRLQAAADALIGSTPATTGSQVIAVAADCSNEVELRAALDRVVAAHGVPEVVVYNAAVIQADAIGDLTAQQHLDAWAVNVVGAITTAAHVVPAMIEQGGGTFIITGGMPQPKSDYLSLSLGKAGVRALVTMLDQQYGAAGLHAATVTVSGGVAPGTPWDPTDIADHYWRLHTQPRTAWTHEVVL